MFENAITIDVGAKLVTFSNALTILVYENTENVSNGVRIKYMIVGWIFYWSLFANIKVKLSLINGIWIITADFSVYGSASGNYEM